MAHMQHFAVLRQQKEQQQQQHQQHEKRQRHGVDDALSIEQLKNLHKKVILARDEAKKKSLIYLDEAEPYLLCVETLEKDQQNDFKDLNKNIRELKENIINNLYSDSIFDILEKRKNKIEAVRRNRDTATHALGAVEVLKKCWVFLLKIKEIFHKKTIIKYDDVFFNERMNLRICEAEAQEYAAGTDWFLNKEENYRHWILLAAFYFHIFEKVFLANAEWVFGCISCSKNNSNSSSGGFPLLQQLKYATAETKHLLVRYVEDLAYAHTYVRDGTMYVSKSIICENPSLIRGCVGCMTDIRNDRSAGHDVDEIIGNYSLRLRDIWNILYGFGCLDHCIDRIMLHTDSEILEPIFSTAAKYLFYKGENNSADARKQINAINYSIKNIISSPRSSAFSSPCTPVYSDRRSIFGIEITSCNIHDTCHAQKWSWSVLDAKTTVQQGHGPAQNVQRSKDAKQNNPASEYHVRTSTSDNPERNRSGGCVVCGLVECSCSGADVRGSRSVMPVNVREFGQVVVDDVGCVGDDDRVIAADVCGVGVVGYVDGVCSVASSLLLFLLRTAADGNVEVSKLFGRAIWRHLRRHVVAHLNHPKNASKHSNNTQAHKLQKQYILADFIPNEGRPAFQFKQEQQREQQRQSEQLFLFDIPLEHVRGNAETLEIIFRALHNFVKFGALCVEDIFNDIQNIFCTFSHLIVSQYRQILLHARASILICTSPKSDYTLVDETFLEAFGLGLNNQQQHQQQLQQHDQNQQPQRHMQQEQQQTEQEECISNITPCQMAGILERFSGVGLGCICAFGISGGCVELLNFLGKLYDTALGCIDMASRRYISQNVSSVERPSAAIFLLTAASVYLHLFVACVQMLPMLRCMYALKSANGPPSKPSDFTTKETAGTSTPQEEQTAGEIALVATAAANEAAVGAMQWTDMEIVTVFLIRSSEKFSSVLRGKMPLNLQKDFMKSWRFTKGILECGKDNTSRVCYTDKQSIGIHNKSSRENSRESSKADYVSVSLRFWESLEDLDHCDVPEGSVEMDDEEKNRFSFECITAAALLRRHQQQVYLRMLHQLQMQQKDLLKVLLGDAFDFLNNCSSNGKRTGIVFGNDRISPTVSDIADAAAAACAPIRGAANEWVKVFPTQVYVECVALAIDMCLECILMRLINYINLNKDMSPPFSDVNRQKIVNSFFGCLHTHMFQIMHIHLQDTRLPHNHPHDNGYDSVGVDDIGSGCGDEEDSCGFLRLKYSVARKTARANLHGVNRVEFFSKFISILEIINKIWSAENQYIYDILDMYANKLFCVFSVSDVASIVTLNPSLNIQTKTPHMYYKQIRTFVKNIAQKIENGTSTEN